MSWQVIGIDRGNVDLRLIGFDPCFDELRVWAEITEMDDRLLGRSAIVASGAGRMTHFIKTRIAEGSANAEIRNGALFFSIEVCIDLRKDKAIDFVQRLCEMTSAIGCDGACTRPCREGPHPSS